MNVCVCAEKRNVKNAVDIYVNSWRRVVAAFTQRRQSVFAVEENMRILLEKKSHQSLYLFASAGRPQGYLINNLASFEL